MMAEWTSMLQTELETPIRDDREGEWNHAPGPELSAG